MIKRRGPLFIFALLLLAVCSCQKVPSTGKIAVEEDMEFGSASVMMSIDEFNDMGFKYGDSVNVKFSNGRTLEDIPYYNGYYAPVKEPLVVAYPGNEYIIVARNYGLLWEEFDLTDGDTVDISLASPGKYLLVQNTLGIKYKDEREAYNSDEVFANFRNVKTGRMCDGILYRSASPCDNTHKRASYVDGLIAKAGIRTVVDLADNEEKIEGFIAGEDFDSPYFYSLYKSNDVITADLKADYTSDDFKSKLSKALVKMSESDGPYLINCLEGKDRTGFVVALLGALTGATYDEMVNDYLISYYNYYGIDRQNDPQACEIILENIFNPMLRYIAGVDKNSDLSTADFEAGAEAYLSSGKMTGDEIHALKDKLTQPLAFTVDKNSSTGIGLE